MGPNRNRTPLTKPVPPCVSCGDEGGPVHPNSTTGRPERTKGLCKVCYERMRQQAARHRRRGAASGNLPRPDRDEPVVSKRKAYPAYLAELPTLAPPGTSVRQKVYAARAERGYNLRAIGDRKHYATWAEVLKVVRDAGRPDTPEWHPPMAPKRGPLIDRATRRALRTWRVLARDPSRCWSRSVHLRGRAAGEDNARDVA